MSCAAWAIGGVGVVCGGTMSLGLPIHLAQTANSRALASAARIAALVCLAAAEISVLMPASTGERVAGDHGARITAEAAPNGALAFATPWVGALALLPMAAMLIVLTGIGADVRDGQGRAGAGRGRAGAGRGHARAGYRRVFRALQRIGPVTLTIVTLIVGTGSTFVYILALLAQNTVYQDTELFVMALPVIALTLIGGSGSGALMGVIWASCGFVAGELAVFVAAVAAGRQFVLTTASLGSYLLVVGVLALDGLTRGTHRGIQGSILRTMRAEQTAILRQRVAADAATELHDTTLSELAMIAQSRPGPITPRLRRRIEGDLEGWGSDRAAAIEHRANRMTSVDGLWQASELAAAIEHARDEGLDVDVSGDRSVIARLPTESVRAISLAARQCFENVLRHSGETFAELALSASEHDVSVTIVDSGSGFDTRATASDRLGLQQSIRQRIERIGGTALIFSSPGAGTSVSMIVPVAPSADGAVFSGEARP